MLLLAIIAVIIGTTWFVAKLLAIRKHNQVLYAMYDFRREVTGLMRTERFKEKAISPQDYHKLRRTLDNANLVIDDFEKTAPDLYSFQYFLKSFGKKVYRADIRQKKLSLANNEEIKHQQNNLRKLFSWSVYHSTPLILRNKPLLSFLLQLFGCTRKEPILKKSETYSEWVERNVSAPLARDFSAEH